MNPKLKKVTKDIEKTRSKITELQARLQDMETQKTELENIEYVSIIRNLNMTPDQLAELVKGYVPPAETAVLPDSTSDSNVQPDEYESTATEAVQNAASDDTKYMEKEGDAYDNTDLTTNGEASYGDLAFGEQDGAYSNTAYTAEPEDAFGNIGSPYADEQEDSYYEG